MNEQESKAKIIHGVNTPAGDGLRNLTRVTESHEKRTGTNPEPQTAKPLNFSPPGQGPVSTPATPVATTTPTAQQGGASENSE